MDHVSVNGMQIALRQQGTGQPLVFIHGNSSSSRTWRAQLDSDLNERARLVALDLPGHGNSDPAPDPATYSMPGYAEVVSAVLDAVEAEDAVLVGWSLGGHIALEVAAMRDDLAGLVIFGAPPVGKPPAMDDAFLPNPAMNIGFTEAVTDEDARAYAQSFLTPGSAIDVGDLAADIRATDGAARSGLMASIGEGRFADELEIVAGMSVPLGILHGEQEQLVSLDYLRGLSAPTLWRGEVQMISGAGHAPHVEASQAFNEVLGDLLSDL